MRAGGDDHRHAIEGPRGGLDDGSGDLVPEGDRKVCRPGSPVDEVDVGSAYAGRLDAHDRLVIVECRRRDVVEAHISGSVQSQRSHRPSLPDGRVVDIRRACLPAFDTIT
jgi:hypothetical protein